MLFSNWFAIASNAVTTFICGSITLLLATQLHRDRQSWSLIRLMLNLTLLSFTAVMMRLLAHEGFNIHNMFIAATILTGLLPISLFIFTHDYFSIWTKWRRWLLFIVICFFLLVALGLSLEAILGIPILLAANSIYIAADGTIMYAYGDLLFISVPLVILAELLLLIVFLTVFRLYSRNQMILSKPVMLGVGVLAAGMIIVPMPGLEHYAFEQIFYTVGALMLIGPVLQLRLFEPLSQANQILAHRAEQMALITRVGDTAYAELNLGQLLPDVASQIRQSFGYHSVQIEIFSEQGRCVERVVSSTDKMQTTTNLADASNSVLLPILQIPLEATPSDQKMPVRGVMTVQHVYRHIFDAQEQEVLGILARQIGLAIRNAQLFQEVRRTNAAKTMLLGMVSHELRNRVGEIISISSGMLDEPSDYANQLLPDAYHPDVQSLLDIGYYQRQLLNDVLDWGQIESGKMNVSPRSIDPLPILQDEVRHTKGIVHSGVAVISEFESPLPLLRAHDLRLKQVLRNLLTNAAKFTSQGAITIGTQVDEGFLRFSIADTGPGMTEQEQARLFQLYTQASPDIRGKYGGSGLGLVISEDLIQMHGGRIWLESKVGEGTTFYFTLPIAGIEPDTAQSTSA